MKTKVAMAVVVFAFAAVVHAGVTLQITPNAAPAPGLESYTVTAVSTDATNLVTFSDIHVTGSTHNVWGFGGDPKTPKTDPFPSTFLKAEWAAYDTHLIVPGGDILTELGSALDEGNDGSNPAGLSLELDPPFAGFTPVIGVGEYGHGASASSFALVPAAQATSVDLLQVVIPEGDKAWLSMGVVNAQLAKTAFENVEIPEPATLSLLAFGGLALLRRRK